MSDLSRRSFLGLCGMLDRLSAEALSPRPQKFSVFFDSGSTRLHPQAENAFKLTVELFRDYEGRAEGRTIVEVSAHTDSFEGQTYDLDLSPRRGEVVKNRLIELGIPPDRIRLLTYADSNPLVGGLPPGSREPQNRRVEIN